MTTLDLDAVKFHLSQKTNEQLIDILRYTQDDYQGNVIPLIDTILLDRGVSVDDLDGYKHAYVSLKDSINSQPVTYKPAGFWIRFCQYIIDHFICYGCAYVVGIVGEFTKADEGNYYGIVIIIYIVYYTILLWFFKSTIGMMIMGLTAIDAGDKKPISLYHSFLRGIWMVFNFCLLQLGNLAMLFDKNKKTLADRFTKTLIVYKNS